MLSLTVSQFTYVYKIALPYLVQTNLITNSSFVLCFCFCFVLFMQIVERTSVYTGKQSGLAITKTMYMVLETMNWMNLDFILCLPEFKHCVYLVNTSKFLNIHFPFMITYRFAFSVLFTLFLFVLVFQRVQGTTQNIK